MAWNIDKKKVMRAVVGIAAAVAIYGGGKAAVDSSVSGTLDLAQTQAQVNYRGQIADQLTKINEERASQSLAQLEQSAKQVDKLVKEAGKELAVNPNNTAAQAQLSSALNLQKSIDAQIEAIKAALKANNMNADKVVDQGKEQHSQLRWLKALPMLLEAL